MYIYIYSLLDAQSLTYIMHYENSAWYLAPIWPGVPENWEIFFSQRFLMFSQYHVPWSPQSLHLKENMVSSFEARVLTWSRCWMCRPATTEAGDAPHLAPFQLLEYHIIGEEGGYIWYSRVLLTKLSRPPPVHSRTAAMYLPSNRNALHQMLLDPPGKRSNY